MKSERLLWSLFFTFILVKNAHSKSLTVPLFEESDLDNGYDVIPKEVLLDHDIIEAQMMDLEMHESKEDEKEDEKEGRSIFKEESASLNGLDYAFNSWETDNTEDKEIRRLGKFSQFKPLMEAPCNAPLLENADKCSTEFSALIKEGESTVVPCGTCAFVDDSLEGNILELAGLNIEGKLVFPKNRKVTLKTPFVYVQGQLDIQSDQEVNPDNLSVQFILTGTTPQSFTPNNYNSEACPSSSCAMGTKPFVVAGGKVNIHAYPDKCPTWVKLLDVESNKVVPTSWETPEEAPTNCDRVILNENYQKGTDHWDGNLGAKYEVVPIDNDVDGEEEGHALKISKRKWDWQGPTLDMTQFRTCLAPNVQYLFSTRIRLTKSDGSQSNCSSKKTNCVRIGTRNSDADNKQKWFTKGEMRPSLAVKDGEWFDLVVNMKFDDRETSPDSTYEIFQIYGPEAGVDMEVDYIRLELPPESGYPDESKPEEMCNELFPGQAIVGAAHPFPLSTTHIDGYGNNVAPLVVRKEASTTYYSVIGRNYNWQSMSFPINPECAVSGVSYLLKSKIRLHSKTIVHDAMIELRTWKDTTELSRIAIATCPPVGGDLGWVECNGGFTFEDKHSVATKTQWRLITGKDKHSDVDYKDISVKIAQGSVSKITVDKSVQHCWGEGSEILIASHTLKYDESQVVTIDSVSVNESSDTITLGLNKAILPPTTEAQDPNFAVEVALLSRNVVVQGAQDNTSDNSKSGGYMSILNTPSVNQLIQGVHFKHMGQRRVVDRFPVHFKMCGDLNGSEVNKNSITDSYHRCLVLQNTSYVSMAENIAYNTAGHCYVLQDGGETNNSFKFNLGAMSTRLYPPLSGESDHYPATYYTRNPNNVWLGNVAAGSYDVGFKVDLPHKVLKESSAFHPKYNPRKAGLLKFEGNIGHSNNRGVYMLRLENDKFAGTNMTALVNVKSFRNKYDGIRFYGSRYLGIKNSILADNRNGFVSDNCDSLYITHSTFVGQSHVFEEMLLFQSTTKFCPSSSGLRGLYIEPERYRRNPYSGLNLSNLYFKGYDKTEDCTGSVAIDFVKTSRDTHWDLTSSLKNISIVDSRSFDINGCSVVSKNIDDVIITDIDGSLSPDPLSTFKGPSSIVSIEPHMTNFANGPCTELPGQCLTFCENTCLRTVTFEVERDATENLTLQIMNEDATKSIEVTGNTEVSSNMYWNRYYTKYRRFSVSLPAGAYTAKFRQEGFEHSFPIFARELWEPEPQCSGHATVGDINLVFGQPKCESFIKNGDMEDGTNYWHHTRGDVQALLGKGVKGSDAIGSIKRSNYYHGIGQFVDIPCIRNNIGKQLEFKAWFKLIDSNGKVVSCDPNRPSDQSKSCPVLYAVAHHHKDSSKMSFKNHYESNLANIVLPVEENEFNLLHGVFPITEKLGNAESIFLYITKFNKNYQIILDNISLKLYEPSCNNLVNNGDFKNGNSLHWGRFGSPHIEIVPGYDGDGDNAIKVSHRTRTWNGPSQNIKVGCFKEGERYLVKAKVKLEKEGDIFYCNAFDFNGNTRCPEIMLRARKHGSSDEYKKIASIAAPTFEADWNNIAGVFYATEKQINADKLTVWFEDQHITVDITVDNFEVTHFPQDCKNAILNPTFEDGSVDFWTTNSRTNSKISIYTPGSDSKFAIRSYNRKKNYYGLQQTIDDNCLTIGETMVISAQFKLQHTNGTGVLCNFRIYSTNGENCPPVYIQGRQCSGNSVNMRLWNNYLFPWKPDDFNDFQTEFSVDENFASCKYVTLGVRDINNDWEIITDNIKVQPKSIFSPTPSPTLSPTVHVPTIITQLPTSSPVTDPPQTLPPTGPSTSCPSPEQTPKSIDSGSVFLQKSAEDSLCILTKVISSGNKTSMIPVGRSYNGNDWEKSPGRFAGGNLDGNDWLCYSNSCYFYLPDLDIGENYMLSSYTHTSTDRDLVARFLESTTFGTTKKELASWDYSQGLEISFVNWIKQQIETEMTSHREYWRKRTNPSWSFSRKAGKSSSACQPNSRWRKFSFTAKDVSKSSEEKYIETRGEKPYVVSVNSQLRTVVNAEIRFRNDKFVFEYNHRHLICRNPQPPSPAFPRGRLWLTVTENSNCQEISWEIGNFILNLDGVENQITYLISFTEANSFQSIDGVFSNEEEYLLEEGFNGPECDTIPDILDENDPPVFGKMPDGTWLIHDRRLILQENTLESPISDGGGATFIGTAEQTYCSNAPRTFLNEDTCELSHEISSCGSLPPPVTEILLDDDNIRQLHKITGRYIYAMLGLAVKDQFNHVIDHPCTPGWRSRWEKISGSCPNPSNLNTKTRETLTKLFELSNYDTNLRIRDIFFPETGEACDSSDTDPEIQIQIGDVCWENKHPDHMSVYDLTYWTREDTHPGNMAAAASGRPNPIKKWADIHGSATITFPSSHPIYTHPMSRWDAENKKFQYVGRYGDHVRFRDLPNEIRIDEVAEHYGATGSSGHDGILVCGSPGEVANDAHLGSSGFDLAQDNGERDTSSWSLFNSQRETIWMTAIMSATDQFRQRMAWALSQILVVVKSAIASQDRNTEVFLNYYDILVRRAFGNYRDILKEISYSPLMAENLSFLQSKSHAYLWEKSKKLTFADENFAREIMQLFSTGLVKLHLDGTPDLDDQGNSIKVYTNRHIMSYARAWTGFDMQIQRGNTEDHERSGNRLDPMRIIPEWRDRFPKIDLKEGYIGDSYPLCIDEPNKMFLKKGATYRLLGSSSLPELVEDDVRFQTDETIKRFVLSDKSKLKAKICGAGVDGGCQFENKVVLDSDLPCDESECKVDTLRVIQVSDSIFYEYVRPPCVEYAFYNNAVKLSKKKKSEKGTMCANPLLPVASEACCPKILQTGMKTAQRNVIYDGERMSYELASARCQDVDKQLCDFDEIDIDQPYKTGYHWTVDQCKIRLKIDSVGDVSIVYEMESPGGKMGHVDMNSQNYFPVNWKNGEYPNSQNNCSNNLCQSLQNGDCLCETQVVDSSVFNSMPNNKQQVFNELTAGAYDPRENSNYIESSNLEGVKAYTKNGKFNQETIFEVTDTFGRTFFLKNERSDVLIKGVFGTLTPYSFKNPPSFMSLIPTETTIRDAQYETEAVLDSYFYHENTAPFLAVRLIQRFGISNPSPRYVREVATAFRKGRYETMGQTFGIGKYGDLAATSAAIILDREARSNLLDVDPSYGSLREPLLKVTALMRNLEFNSNENSPNIQLTGMERVIGQMAHESPTVFSFFLPEYEPDGPISAASLVSPEALVLDMPKIIGSLNGMLSMIRYGLSACFSGFGVWVGSGGCHDNGSFNRASGKLDYYPESLNSASDVVDEMATLLTSGRLSTENRKILINAYNKANNPGIGIRDIQQLMISSPEFHSTNVIKRNGKPRKAYKSPKTSDQPYKAMVFLMLAGGCDSYNMLVPYTCKPSGNETDLYTQYLDIRQQVAMSRERLKPIEVGNQICEEFGIHENLEILQTLYNDKDALFFANTGVLNQPTTKSTYSKDHVTQLFAHNTMQQETKRVDPFEDARGTGIMGRITDALTKKGLRTGSLAIDGTSIALVGYPGVSSPMSIIGQGGVNEFDPRPNNGDSLSHEDLLTGIENLNNATDLDSGMFAETWSSLLLDSLKQNQRLYDALGDIELSTTFPNNSLGRKLETVAKLIQTHETRGTNRDVFYLQIGGFDTHSNVDANLINRFTEINSALDSFVTELKHKSLWNSVSLIETSDFARTLNPNGGDGTDHAWGGHYFMAGGAVKGGQILGEYPDDLTTGGSQTLSRGRMIPTTSWDQIWNGIAQWMGVEDADLNSVCPNRDKFAPESLLSEDNLFVTSGRRLRSSKAKYLRRVPLEV